MSIVSSHALAVLASCRTERERKLVADALLYLTERVLALFPEDTKAGKAGVADLMGVRGGVN